MRDEATGTLNRISVERRRYEEAAARLRARLDALPWSLVAPLVEASTPPATREFELSRESFVHDPDAVLDAQELADLEQQLQLLKDELDVEARVLFVTPPREQSFEAFGTDTFDALTATGFGANGLGILLLVDGNSGRARVEVGYRLEPYLTDALAGALAREHLAPVIDGEAPGLDLRLILRIVRQRLRNAVLAGSFEIPRAGAPEFRAGARFGAGGAGATANSADGSPEFAAALPPDERTRYEPGATVRETYDRYLHWLRSGAFDASVGIFTPESRELISTWSGWKYWHRELVPEPNLLSERIPAALLLAVQGSAYLEPVELTSPIPRPLQGNIQYL